MAAAPILRRDVITASGKDTITFLQGQLSQDVAGMAEGESRWTLHLTPQGRLIALARLTRRDATTVVIDTDPGAGAAVQANLQRFKIRTACDLELREQVRTVHTDGPAPGALPGFPTVGGWDLLDAAGDEPDASPEELAAWRVENLVPAGGAEIVEQWLPPETGLLAITVAFGKGCYVGQELVERIDARGRVNRMLCALTIGDAASAAAGDEIVRGRHRRHHRRADDRRGRWGAGVPARRRDRRRCAAADRRRIVARGAAPGRRGDRGPVRRSAAVVAAVAASAVLVGCVEQAPPFPVVPSTLALRPSTSAPPRERLSRVTIPPLDGTRPTPTIVFGTGDVTITGRVIGPDGPVPQASVRIERFVGEQSATTIVTTDEDGRYRLSDVTGGQVRIQAFRSPDYAQRESVVGFASEVFTQDLEVVKLSGTRVQWAIAPARPLVDRGTNLVIQVGAQKVDADGIVRTGPCRASASRSSRSVPCRAR